VQVDAGDPDPPGVLMLPGVIGLRLAAVALAGTALLTSCSPAAPEPSPPPSFHVTPFHASEFVDPRGSGNPWFPLQPGMQWVRQGTTLIGNRVVPYEVITTITDVVRTIKGARTVLSYDLSMGAGQVVQESLDYFAQDRSGNIWDLGSTTEQYEAGRFVAVDEAWLAGVDGAAPGILMPADPRQARAWLIARPPGESGDAAAFARMDPRVCTPFGCYRDVLVTEEGKRDALNNEFKYYVRGAGQVRDESLSGSHHFDNEHLMNLRMLSPEGLAEADAAALRIDREAVKEWPKVFGSARASRAP
jgi:hypothetical protein